MLVFVVLVVVLVVFDATVVAVVVVVECRGGNTVGSLWLYRDDVDDGGGRCGSKAVEKPDDSSDKEDEDATAGNVL